MTQEDVVDPQLVEGNDEEALYDAIDVSAMVDNEEGEEPQDEIFFSDMDLDDEQELEEQQQRQNVLDAFSDDGEDWSEDDDQDDFAQALREAKKFKRRRTKKDGKGVKKRYTGPRLSKDSDPEVRLLLSTANELFVSRDYDNAEIKFLEVIKKDPRNFPAYRSLGEIYLLQGKPNRSCNSWFLAAHLQPNDGEFWASVAKQSRDLGHKTQALYCLGRAISSGYKTYDVLLERAILYRETAQFGRASESLQKLMEVYPKEGAVVRELALIYNNLNRVNDAIAMYLKLFEQNSNMRKSGQTPEEVNFAIFDWSALNILAELFVNQKNYSIAIRTIKHIARWLHGREGDAFWEDVPDDSEFDERRYENAKFEALDDILKNKSHKLPIDIRVKLGSLRLNINDIDEALVHYNFLLNDDILETADLFSEAAHRLEEAQLFGDALKFYQPLSKLEDFQTSQLYTSLARCCSELGKFDDARTHYKQALVMDPENVDIMLSLVEVLYYLEEENESQLLLQQIGALRQRGGSPDSNIDASLSQSTESQALIENVIKLPKKSRLTEAEKHARDNRIKQNIIDKYKRLQRLYQGLEQGDEIATSTWIQLASELIEIFSNVKNFFPKDRSRQFKGIITRTKGFQMDIGARIDRISQLYEGFTSKIEEKVVLTSKQEFRGLTYNEWFGLFMDYALAMARFRSADDANSIIDNAKNVNVFFQDKQREQLMNLVKLAISMKRTDQRDLLQSLRLVLNTNQFNRDLLRMFLLVQPSGKLCTENFISINHQKYFLRQIKAYDALRLKKSIPGMANIVNKELDVQGRVNVYLMYIYACLLFTNRSYVPSLVYLTRIYKEYKGEVIICLLSGLAHIHRSMQRSSSNRHMELLQGLKYMMEYYDLRTSDKFGDSEHQEALYNLGRVYHLLGLFSPAVDFYNRVLTEFQELDIEEDLKRHAAYNLVLIYNASGNTRLSNKIMEEYLTI